MITSLRRILVASVAVTAFAASQACSESTPAPTVPTTSTMQGPEVEVLPEKYTNTDSSIIIVGASTLYCNPDTGSIDLPTDGDVNDFLGDIRVRNQGLFTRIEWGKPGAHVVIVNEQQWGFVNKSGSDAPASSKIVHATWGGEIKRLKVCGKR